jgi:hypothetical protein
MVNDSQVVPIVGSTCRRHSSMLAYRRFAVRVADCPLWPPARTGAAVYIEHKAQCRWHRQTLGYVWSL